MRLDLGWSYAQAGAMNTANAAGYLIGALAAAPLAARFGDKRGFLLGLLLTAASLLATGLTSDYAVLAVLRAVAGAAGALSLITGGALAAAAGGGGGKGRPALALGVYFGGAGFGMVVSAFAVPALVAEVGWRTGWFVLGALGVAATVAALPALARAPDVAAHATHRRPASRHARDARAARGPGQLRAVRRRLHRLHDVHRRLSAQRPGLRSGRCHAVLGLRRRCGDRCRSGVGTPAGAAVRRTRRRRGECRGGGWERSCRC